MYDGVTVVSFCPAINIDGTRIVVMFVLKIAGASPIAVFSDGRRDAADMAPPPPIEWPITACRFGSIRSRTRLRWVR